MSTPRRQQGVREIETVEDPKTGEKVRVTLQVEKGLFQATVGTEHFADADLKVLRKAVQAELAASRNLVWAPVIVVHHESRSYEPPYRGGVSMGHKWYVLEAGHAVSLRYWRVELATKKGKGRGKKVERPFLVDGLTDDEIGYLERCWPERKERERQAARARKENVEARAAGHDIKDAYGYAADDDDATATSSKPSVIPYSDQRWAALIEIEGLLRLLGERLAGVLAPDCIVAALDSAGLGLMSGPPRKESDDGR